MKLLVITYNALMTSTPNGRTMISLLDGYSPDEIVNFCVTGTPDKKYCGKAYKITNFEALKSFLLRSEKGGEINPESAEVTNRSYANDICHGKRAPWKYYVREIVWKKGKWNREGLRAWLEAQGFDAVVYMYGDGAALQDFAVFASEFLDIPLVVYACEEYCFKDFNYLDRNDKSFFFKKYFELSKAATARLFQRADALICNTDQLGKLYGETYGIQNVITIMMASDMEFVENTGVADVEKMKISYCGSLGVARNGALLDIAEALHEVDPCLKLDVYGRADAQTEQVMNACPYINFHGFVNYDEVQKVMRSSSLLTQMITFDPYFAKDRRFGFSTKHADSLACGTPYFMYSMPEIVEMRFMTEHDCAFLVTEKEKLVEVLREALFDEAKRKEKVANARKVTEQYFNKEKNIATVHSLIESCVAKKGAT